VNGSAIGTNSSFVTEASSTFTGIIGDEDANAPDSPFSGLIADVQITTNVLGPDWFLTDFNNWNNPGAFIRLGRNRCADSIRCGWKFRGSGSGFILFRLSLLERYE